MSAKILAFAASARGESINRRLISLAVKQAEKTDAHVTVLEYADFTAPLYMGEETTALPAGVKHLGDALRAHDGVLLAAPEYNWSMPGSLKNLIDWLSIDPTKPLNGRTALLMCASPSVRGGVIGLQQLRVPLEHLGMIVYPHTVGIGEAHTLLGEYEITRKKEQAFLSHCVSDFVRITTALKG